ncbi:MAG: SapC family protein [Hyphomicrobium aestuarii]|nr:SapC family protein [Hyphomicrobium aestuarii]
MLNDLPALTDGLPSLYREVVPLTPERHRGLALRTDVGYGFAGRSHTLPITIDEFAAVQRDYPILFTTGERPAPAALLGLDPMANPYVDGDGRWKAGAYVPAYVRRYPFLLIRHSRDSDNFVLCVDRTAPHVAGTQFADAETSAAAGATSANPLFDDKGATKLTAQIMQFCVGYEQGIERTRAFGEELQRLDLLVTPTIRLSKGGRSVDLNGFRAVSEERLAKLDDATLARLARSGALSAIHAHLFSMQTLGQVEQLGSSIDTLAKRRAN